MAGSWRSGLGSALFWLIFPLVPTALAAFFHRFLNWGQIDPREWSTRDFVIFLGPLGGFAYLAGATSILPDGPWRRGWRRLLSLPGRRSLWVAIGPWIGFFAVWGWALAMDALHSLLARLLSPARLEAWHRSSMGSMGEWLGLSLVAACSYGWLLVAFAAARRAHRRGKLVASLNRGLLTAVGFLGSLVGGFWAATSAFRSYFFDPRIAPLLLLALLSLAGLSGCSSTPTVGDLRRRELFQAMTASWVLGLALAWRWLGRERK